MNSDRSIAVGSGLSLNPGKSRFYDSFDKLRFEHLQRLRNDASCRARVPSALYKFCEETLFKIIDTDVITEIYADSEYTGEKQLIYLMIRSKADITMCLKQNPKIKKWKEQTIKKGRWEDYGEDYRIASLDFTPARWT